MSFKVFFLFLALVAISEQNHFNQFDRVSLKEHVCEIILKSGHWSRRRCHLKLFSIFSSGGHSVQWSGTILAIFGRGSSKEHFCEIILKLDHWSRRRCRLKKLLTDGRTDGRTDYGRRTNIDQNSSP